MGTRKSPSAPQWQVILEDIRSQNRSTLEAVEAFRQSIEERIDRIDREIRDRDGLHALAIADLRQEVRLHTSDLTELKRLSLRYGGDIAELKELGFCHSSDITELKQMGERHGHDIRELKVTVQENTVEVRSLSQRIDALNRLEERVAALEKRPRALYAAADQQRFELLHACVRMNRVGEYVYGQADAERGRARGRHRQEVRGATPDVGVATGRGLPGAALPGGRGGRHPRAGASARRAERLGTG